MKTFTTRLFYGIDAATAWPDQSGVRQLMVDTIMQSMTKSQDEAAVLLDTNATFPGRGAGQTLQKKPAVVLRAAIPHLMSEIKKVAGVAFISKYHEVTGKGERVPLVDKRGRRRSGRGALVLSPNEACQCLWNNSFLTTQAGRSSMQEALRAVVDKWANIDDFLVPASSRVKETYYRVASPLFGLLVTKVRVVSLACVRVQLSLLNFRCMSVPLTAFRVLLRCQPALLRDAFGCSFLWAQVRVVLRVAAKLPPVVWGGDHIDEGHRKQWAAELLGSRSYIPDHGRVKHGFLFIDGPVHRRRRVPGFGKRGLSEILERMRLEAKPTFDAATPTDDFGRPRAQGSAMARGCSVGGSSDGGSEDEVVISEYTDDSSGSDDSITPANVCDDSERAGSCSSLVGVGNEALEGGLDSPGGLVAPEGSLDSTDGGGEEGGSQDWGVGLEGDGDMPDVFMEDDPPNGMSQALRTVPPRGGRL